jgi:hypothetical protein
MGLYKEGKMDGRDLFYGPIYPSPLLSFIFPIRKVSTRPFTTKPYQAWPAGLWGALVHPPATKLERSATQP